MGETDNEDTKPFQNRYLSAEQDFEGYILADDPAVMQEITGTLTDTVWLGADRYAAFGKCAVMLREAVQKPHGSTPTAVRNRWEMCCI